MRKKLFTFLLALVTSVGMSWATDPIVIVTNTSQSSYTQGTITITCSKPGDSEGFYLEKDGNETATITNSGSSTISQIELGIGWFPDDRSYVRANGAEPTSSDPYSITFSNVNSNNVTLTITDNKIQIRDVTITLADEGGSAQAGLQVTELQVLDSWEDNPTMLSTSDMPGFVAITKAEAQAWDAAPAGNVVLIFAFEENAATSLYFKNGVYQAAQAHNITYEDLYAWYSNGDKIFYTGGGSTPTGLQVIELQVPSSWEGDNTLVTVSDLPGFVVFTLEEAGTWAAPEGNVNLIYMSKNNEGVRATSFFDGVWGQEYVAGFTRSVVFGWASNGNRIFYTTDGSELTPKPSWVRDGDDWDDATKTLTVNSNPGTGAYASQSEIENLIISDAVTSIGQAAFAGCSNISYVTCGNNIQTIGVGAFTMCGFTYIELPASVTTIGKSAFYSCSNLSSVTIGNNVASIGDHAFDACVSLTEITIPASVTTIGVDAFYNCTGMTDVYCYPNAADLTWNEDGCDDFRSGNATQCHVNADQLDAYQTKFNGVVRVTFVGDLPASTPAGLQVTELEIPDSWQNDQTLVTISDLPGFVAVSLEEAEAWTAPEGDVILIYAGTNEGVTAIDFNNGVLVGMGPFGGFSRADIFDWGYKIFYTSGGSTPAVDQAVQNVIDLIDAIGSVTYTQACKDKIDAARDAYDALNADQKALVSNYSTLTDAEDAYAALIPVVTNYSISLDGITENADKVTLNNASAAEGETITLTPAAGYQITAFTASYASAYSVRVTADPNVNVYDATPYVGALPKEFTENVTPGQNGATFHNIEGDDPFTPVPASVLEYVGMNAAKDQMTIRVNDAFSGIIRVNYTYNVETCEWDEYEQQEICMGGTAQASVRVVCEAAGGVAPASKDAVTGAYSFTMPAGNVTITATVEAIPAPTAAVIGDPNNASEVETFLTTYDGQTIDELIIDRPVRNNMYNTLCLPFHMDADQIANSSLNGVEIYEFVDADVTNDELYLYTSEQKHEIVAGRPYLVKFSAASQLNKLNFIDVEINNADLDDQAVTIKGVTFKGTFQPTVLGAQEGLNFNGGHLFLMANNTLMWPNTNNPLKPFRAYFTVNVDAGQSAGMPVRRGMPAHIGGPAQIVTGVENVQGDNVQSTKVVENGVLYIIKNGVKYNAQGQIVK